MDKDDIIKQRQDRFKSLGIPVPIEKPNLDQPITNVKDPKMLQRIQEIKNGAKKGEFNELLSVGEKKGFKPLPEPKKRMANKSENTDVKAPALENFSPISNSNEMDMYEKLFSADVPTPTYNRGSNGPRLQEEVQYDNNGTDFLNDFRQKLQARAITNSSSNSNSSFGIKTQYEQPKIDLQEIESKIYQISSEVAKKIAQETIDQVLNQYLSKKTNLSENTFKKVKDDIIKIGDKYYKITPVTLKTKTN
jgi:hypothetical protein